MVLAVLAGGWYGLGWTLFYSSASAEREAAIKEARARGQPIWFSELEPPRVPPEEDGMPLFIEATKKLRFEIEGFHEALTRADGVAREGDEQGNRRVEERELKVVVEQNREALDMTRQALQKAIFRTPIDFQTRFPMGTQLAHAQSARDVARLFMAEFHLALARGETEEAARIIDDVYILAEVLKDEPTTVSQLLRVRITRYGTDALSLLLGRAELSPSLFNRLDARLASLGDGFRLRSTVLAHQAAIFTQLEHGSLDATLGGNGTDKGSSLFYRPQAMREQAALLRYHSAIADCVDDPGPNAWWRRRELELDAKQSHVTAIPALLVPLTNAVAQAGMNHRQSLVHARLAMRVDRYYRRNGRLPGALTEVLDDQMTELPTCIYSGLPLIMKPQEAAGFIIYGPGVNGVDDGGGKKPDIQEGPAAFRVIYKPASKAREDKDE
ncbi:MAG: hypothetical protein HYS13_14020 [Planctomycetia bacterium]|nr:hypothetical protein [Planctomycetia bacterium]